MVRCWRGLLSLAPFVNISNLGWMSRLATDSNDETTREKVQILLRECSGGDLCGA